MTPLQVTNAECANCEMSGEEWLARKYCEPIRYWRVTQQLDGSKYYTFKEINYPKNWLKVVAKYTQQEPSPAAKRLHLHVEQSRPEFRAKQGRIFTGKVLIQPSSQSQGAIIKTRTSPEKEQRELAAWNKFNARKQASLKEYLRALKTRVVRQRNRRESKPCAGLEADGQPCGERVYGRAIYCEICGKQRHATKARESRARKAKNCARSVTNYTREIRPQNGAFRCPHPKTSVLESSFSTSLQRPAISRAIPGVSPQPA